MPKYLIHASYTREGAEGVRTNGGTSRRDAVAKTAESLGGSLEGFYFAFGDYDAEVIVDLPDNEAAAAVAMTVNAAGGATAKTTVLLTPEQGIFCAPPVAPFRTRERLATAWYLRINAGVLCSDVFSLATRNSSSSSTS